MTVTYDALTGRPDRIEHTKGAATLASFDYGFDTDGKILSIADAGGTRDFTYDATLQLTGGGYASNPESYAYDAEGNRTSSHLSGAYTHDTANRLREDDTTCYGYDANGNLTTKRVKVGTACAGDVTSYTWDVLNRLVRIDNPDGSYSAYRYDAQGRRIEKDVNGALTRYVYDGPDILLEFDATGSLAARYSHGNQVDQPLAEARGGASYFYHTDHLGSVRLLTDAAGAVVSRYDYDAFGNLEPTSFEGVANPYGFTARERDAESGLMFYRARYYDPKIGRFVSEDPLGLGAGDLNFYGYVFNSPQNYFDPYGLLVEYGAESCFSGAAGAAIGGFFGAIAETIFNSVVLDITASEEQSTSADTLGAAALAAGISGAGTELVLSGASCGRLPSGRGGSVKLYRAVSTAELDDIAAFGAFRGAPGGYEGKLFTTSAQDAAAFAKNLSKLDGKAAYTIVEASIPRWLADKLYYFTADRLPAVGVDRTLLKEFNAWARIKAWNYIPLPG